MAHIVYRGEYKLIFMEKSSFLKFYSEAQMQFVGVAKIYMANKKDLISCNDVNCK